MKKNQRIPSTFLLLSLSLPLFAGCSKADKSDDLDRTAQPIPLKSATSSNKYDGLDALVAATHRASLVAREKERKETLSKKSWPDGPWGDTLWSLNALYQNEKTDEANARLLKNAQAFLAFTAAEGAPTVFLPEKLSDKSPWAYFALPDYVRILCLFRAENTKYPGRLKPQTEAAMKAALWVWAKGSSKVADTTPDNFQILLGTENHDLTLRPSYYLVASVLKDDPDYNKRLYDDGKTAAEHYTAYNSFFQKWATWRVEHGLWTEVGSDTYQKYAYPSLFNLADLSPDETVRKQFTMFLDLCFIEEAQISVDGRRGGGRSRAGYGENNFEAYKNMLYAPAGKVATTSHSAIIETSDYQLPAAAIALRFLEFPAAQPFEIEDRVLGQGFEGKGFQQISADSTLVNYAWRTPHLILGSTLQDPALANADGTQGYLGISKQNRWCGVVFQNEDFSAIYPQLEKLPGGRPQHPFWSVQYQNVMLVQRITPDKKLGSYNTGSMGVRFEGKAMNRVEHDGWIFVEKDQGYVAVRFLDGGYEWNETNDVARPRDFDRNKSSTRIIFITGDMETNGDFNKFQASVVATSVEARPDIVKVRGGVAGSKIDFYPFNPQKPAKFQLPKINGEVLDLRPKQSFKSPYLNGNFGDGRISITVGPIKHVYDFEKSRIE